jgi:acylphosphatase
MKHLNLRIRGRVQGVGFRAHTRRKALSLGLRGFVENRPDGSVYVEIEGLPDQIDEMVRWCLTGPPMAEVASIDAEDGPLANFEDFEVRR